MNVEILRSVDALRALAGPWNALAEQVGATPFQRPAWMLAYLDHVDHVGHVDHVDPLACVGHGGSGEGAGLHAIAVREGRDLVALAPLRWSTGSGAQPVLRAIGEGPSDYFDALALPQARGELLDALAPHRVELTALQPDALLRPASASPIEVTPILDLSQPIPTRMREQVRYYRARAQRASVLQTVDASSIDALFELHSARRRARAHGADEGAFADPAVRQFHREVARRLRGFRLHVLRSRQHTIAALYLMLERDTAYYYQAGFDPAWSHIAPGTLLIAAAIGDALAHGARRFDFLRGGEPYKYAWGARDRPLYAGALCAAAPWALEAEPRRTTRSV